MNATSVKDEYELIHNTKHNWLLMQPPIGIYGAIAVTYILLKLLASTQYTPFEGERIEPSVSVIIPEYNEDPELFARGLESVLLHDYPIEEIWVVDDGSDDTRAHERALAYEDDHDALTVARLPENQGKRHAQAYAFERATGDLFVTMDSDTILEPGAITELVKPFADEDTKAVTGYPRAVNASENLLTRLIDMRYWVAFNIERAAQSTMGTVLCCCGVLSAYDPEMVRENLDDYTNQEFLGSESTFGDDRRLTAYALQSGDAVLQSSSHALTDVPTGIGDYLTQQVRWMRSFWRESLLALKWAPSRSIVLTGMIVADLLLPFALIFLGGGAVVSGALAGTLSVTTILGYMGVVAAIAYLRNVRFITNHKRTFALSPIYAVLYITVLLPLSMYALVTMTANGWGTR